MRDRAAKPAVGLFVANVRPGHEPEAAQGPGNPVAIHA